MNPRTLLALAVALAALTTAGRAQDPGSASWIWGHWSAEDRDMKNEVAWFLRHLELPAVPGKAIARVTCDNRFELAVNGRIVGRGNDWTQIRSFDVTSAMHEGVNVIAVRGKNDSGPAALLAILDIELTDGTKLRIDSDARWKTSRTFDAWPHDPGAGPGDGEWKPAAVLAGWETGTWRGARFAEPREFRPAEGFAVETLSESLGSLIALERAEDGRVFVSVERGGILVGTPTGSGGFDFETYTDEIKNSQGMLLREGALWATGKSGDVWGLWRVDDATHEVTEVARVSGGGGEHGAHAVLDGADGALWLVLGNHVQLEAPLAVDSPFRLVYEGHALPRILDPKGHAKKITAPGGTILRRAPEDGRWQLVAAGFRNSYDAAFNAAGDLFAWDSDMEWDIGMPWYREVCVYHVVPGGDYGWRTGSSKWPRSAPDSLPPAIEVGRGSPTGCVFYDGTAFPSRFHDALLAADWSRGRIYAFHLEPDGASYTGKSEVLLEGRPLNVTDLVVDGDGSVLFTLGGRGTAGGLYRLSATQESATPAPTAKTTEAVAAPLAERLGYPDRFVRYLAARELERDPVAEWKFSLVTGGAPLARAEVVLAMSRIAAAGGEAAAVTFRIDQALGLLGTDDADVRRTALRALELDLATDDGLRSARERGLGGKLGALFPTRIEALDRSLAMLIARIQAPGSVDLLAAALGQAVSAEEEIALIYCLRAIDTGWTAKTKRLVAERLIGLRHRPGGASFSGYIKKLEEAFADRLDEKERVALLPEAKKDGPIVRRAVKERRRDFDRVLAYLREGGGAPARILTEGARVYERSCAQCHLVDGRGAGIGPDLTDVAARFGRRDLLETIARPSRDISDQYAAHNLFVRGGAIVSGILVKDEPDLVTVLKSDGTLEEVSPATIEERRPSKLSVMPEGLLDDLTMVEIADLFDFLLARPEERVLLSAARGDDDRLLSPWRTAFTAVDAPGWSLDQGEIVGTAENEETTLTAPLPPGDFILEAEILLESGAAALGFRRTPAADEEQGSGYRFSAAADSWCSLLDHTGNTVSAVPSVDWRPALSPADFNHVLIVVSDGALRFELNGVTTLVRPLEAPSAGDLALILEPGASARFRNLRVLRP